MSAPRPDVVVVGAGVIGCAIAYVLAREGLKVTVLDRAGVAAESSGAAAGILAPRIGATDPTMFALAMASEAQFGPLVAALQDETGIDVEHLVCGALELAYDEASEERLRAKVQRLREGGAGTEWLAPEEVLRLEPAVSPTLRGGLHDPHATQVHPVRLTQALAQAAARRGVDFRIGIEAEGIAHQGGVATAVRTAAADLGAGHVVLAAGAWAGHWAASLGAPIPVFPARGQILSLTALPSPVRSIVYAHGVYLLPRADGTTVLGATYERVGFDKSLTAGALAYLLGAAALLCPDVSSARFERAWAGLRPGSADDLPIVGPAPGWDNVILATGHYRDGILLAPITATIVADLILHRELDLPLADLQPSRFVTA